MRIAAGICALLFAIGAIVLVPSFIDQVFAILRGGPVKWWVVPVAPLLVVGFYKCGEYFFLERPGSSDK
jgi:hypothetical protein